MSFFDFHHHHRDHRAGIYNLIYGEDIPLGFFSAGLHPNLLPLISDDHLRWLREVARHERCVAIGECGLDGLLDTEDVLQEKLFKLQIKLANECQKPIIIHCVKRFSRLVYFKNDIKVPAIIHGFNKKKSVAEDLQKHEFYLSFGKAVLQNVNLQELVKTFPEEKIFLETDTAEFDLNLLYEKTAELKNLKVEELHDQIKKNLKNLNILVNE